MQTLTKNLRIQRIQPFIPYFNLVKKFITSRYFWVNQVRDVILIILFSLPFSYMVCTPCWDDPEIRTISITITALLWVSLSKGNAYVNYTIGQRISWLKEPVKRLIVTIVGHVVYTLFVVITLKYSFQYFMDINIGSLVYISVISIGITFLVTLASHSREFLLSWRQLAIESERSKKEAISAKYEALKNQVNPHFLFNSLNALTNLVYEDADLSAKFIKKLSEVYRYVLESREKELVSLKEELAFVDSYIFLQKIRHEESLQFELDGKMDQNLMVVPLSVQMLVENAFKHNVVSDEEPLTIKVYQENQQLVIENNLQKKNILKEESSGIGLENIKARYEILTDDQVLIEEDHELFRVALPLLKA